MAKVYEKKIIDGVEKSMTRWKTKEECQHVKYANFLGFQEKIEQILLK